MEPIQETDQTEEDSSIEKCRSESTQTLVEEEVKPTFRTDIKTVHFAKAFDSIQSKMTCQDEAVQFPTVNMSSESTCSTTENDVANSTVTLASYMCRLPIKNGIVDQVTVGHQVIGDSLAFALPLAEFPIQIKKTCDVMARLKARISPWVYNGNNRDIQIFSIPRNGTTHIVAGVGIINEEAHSVWDVLKNPACRSIYDRSMKGYHLIENVNEYTQVIRLKFSVKKCIAVHQREAVVVVSQRNLTDQKFICSSRSTHHQLCPEDKKTTRVDIQVATYLIEQFVNANLKKVSKVTYILKVDLPGLPQAVVDYVIKRQPLCIAYVRDAYDWK